MIQDSNHARTAQSASHERCGPGCCRVSVFSPERFLFWSGFRLAWLVSARTGTAVVIPAEGEGAAHQVPMPTDGTVASHLVVAPAQRSLRLLVALLHPVPQPVQPHDLAKSGRW